MILLCVQTTIGNAGKTYAGRSEKGLPAAAACRPQHIYMVIELQHLRFVISCCPLCLRSQRRSTSLLSSFRPLSAVFGTSLLAVCNACCIQCAADDVISGTGQILNSSASDQNNTVLLQIVPFAGDVGCNFDSIGKTYSGDLTKCRIRLLRCSRLDCCAVLTAVQTPRFCGALTAMERLRRELKPLCSAGAVDFLTDVSRPFLTSWLNVGILFHLLVRFCAAQGYAAVFLHCCFSGTNRACSLSRFPQKKSKWKRCGRSHTHELYASAICLSINIF